MLDQTGQLKNTIGSGGSGDGQFSTPYGISIKGDVLYVADYVNRRVQKLDNYTYNQNMCLDAVLNNTQIGKLLYGMIFIEASIRITR